MSIVRVPDIFKAMASGEANATVRTDAEHGRPAFDALDAFLKDGKAPPKGSRPNPSSTRRPRKIR